MTNTLQKAAEWYASHGWPVFPCVPGDKKPLTAHGFKDATRDLAQIRAWWTETPNANIGIATGDAGLVVVDVDAKNGAQGPESWRDLRAELGLDDNTPTVETPTGGLHVYYRANGTPVRNSAGKLGPGLDVRAVGGYVVAPPSRTPQGEYGWALGLRPTDAPTLALPAPLAERLHEPEREKRAAPPVTGMIPHGTQHATLVSLAGSMRRRGMNVGEIDAALQVVNTTRCEQPGPPENIRRIAENVCGLYEPEVEPRGYNLTDLGNAERLIARFGIDLRFCDPLGGWLAWDGRRWLVDTTGHVERLAQATVRAIYAEANAAQDDDTRKALGKHALASESASRQRALLDLAWSQTGIAVASDVWDRDPWLFNCANGTLDLRTGELREHRREDMLTKLAPVDYRAGASDPVLDAYLAAATQGNTAFADYLQRACGYTLTGLTDEETVFLVLGPGATGKSTLVEALLAAMGDYATKTSFDTFLVQRNVGGARPDLVAMRGARMVAAVEPEKERRLATALIKELSGGDTISARALYKPPFSFRPTFKLWLAANAAPEMDDDDTGLWRRLLRLPFEHAIPEGDRDPQIKAHLTSPDGGRAVLAWAVEGCLRWQREKLRPPDMVRRATAELRREFDPLAEFFTERCVVDAGAEYEAEPLRRAYEEWARTYGAQAIGNRDWGRRLKDIGCQRMRKRSMGGPPKTWWKGIGLLADAPDDEDGAGFYDAEPLPF